MGEETEPTGASRPGAALAARRAPTVRQVRVCGTQPIVRPAQFDQLAGTWSRCRANRQSERRSKRIMVGSHRAGKAAGRGGESIGPGGKGHWPDALVLFSEVGGSLQGWAPFFRNQRRALSSWRGRPAGRHGAHSEPQQQLIADRPVHPGRQGLRIQRSNWLDLEEQQKAERCWPGPLIRYSTNLGNAVLQDGCKALGGRLLPGITTMSVGPSPMPPREQSACHRGTDLDRRRTRSPVRSGQLLPGAEGGGGPLGPSSMLPRLSTAGDNTSSSTRSLVDVDSRAAPAFNGRRSRFGHAVVIDDAGPQRTRWLPGVADDVAARFAGPPPPPHG